MSGGPGILTAATSTDGRPALLGAPTPAGTAVRMVLVAVTLAVTGLFVGTALFNALDDDWTTTVVGCTFGNVGDVREQLRCAAPAERARALSAVTAAAAAAVLAGAVMLAVPSVLRHRRRLVPADGRFDAAVRAVADLAAAERLRAPGVLVGPAALREPFCLGRPGRYFVALPLKLALFGNPAQFDAVLRHELAHLRHHDVGLSWTARSLWIVIGPMLALPVVITFAHGEPVLGLDILWRSTALLAVVLLVVRSLLRAREHDADLRVARHPAAAQVLDAELGRRPDPGRGWRSALAWHPTPAQRRRVLADPASAAGMGFGDGSALGFLAAIAVPVVTGIVAAAALDAGVAGLAALGAALTVGALFGTTLGLGLATHGAARITRSAPVVLGVLIGASAGQAASLAQVGVGIGPSALFLPVGLAGTAALTGGLAALRAARPPSMGGTAAVAALGGTTATAAVWAAQEAQAVVNIGGPALLTTWSTSSGTLLLPAAVALVLAIAALWARHGTPRRAGVVMGVVAGACGALGLASYRVMAGPPQGDEDVLRWLGAIVVGTAAVGALVLLGLGLSRGSSGIGSGLIAGPVATITAGVGYLAVNAALGGDPLALAWPVLGAALPLGLLLGAPAALLATAGPIRRAPVTGRSPVAATTLVVAVLSAVTTAGALHGRNVLLPGVPFAATPTTTAGPAVSREEYRTVVVPALLERRVAETGAFGRLRAEGPPGAVAAHRLRSEVLPIAHDLQQAVQAVRTEDPAVSAVHDHALAGAQAHVEAFALLATGLEQGDQPAFDRGQQLLIAGDREWESWARGAGSLS